MSPQLGDDVGMQKTPTNIRSTCDLKTVSQYLLGFTKNLCFLLAIYVIRRGSMLRSMLTVIQLYREIAIYVYQWHHTYRMLCPAGGHQTDQLAEAAEERTNYQ